MSSLGRPIVASEPLLVKKDVQSAVGDNMNAKSAGTTSETNQGMSLGLLILIIAKNQVFEATI